MCYNVRIFKRICMDKGEEREKSFGADRLTGEDQPGPWQTSAEIAKGVGEEVDQTLNIKIPEEKKAQILALGALDEAFKRVIEDFKKPSVNVAKDSLRYLDEASNDPEVIRALGDKVRVVIGFIISKLYELISAVENKKEGAEKALENFRKDVVESTQMGLATVKSTINMDITPIDIKVLEALFNALKVPYSPIDVIRIFDEHDQQKTYELAFKTEEKDIDREVMRGLLRARAVVRKCKEENMPSEVSQVAEEQLAYWQSLNYSDPFPEARARAVDAYFRYKNQLRNWELLMKGEITYDEMFSLYKKLKPKSKKERNDEADA